MPWNTPEDVARHNKRAAQNPKRTRQWEKVANSVLGRTGDEGRAIREANGVVNRNVAGRRRNPRP